MGQPENNWSRSGTSGGVSMLPAASWNAINSELPCNQRPYPNADMAVLLLPANNLGFRANASRPNTTPGVTAPGLHQPPIPGGCFRVASRTNENRFTRVA